MQRRIEKAEVIVDPTVFAYEGAPEDFETLELGETDYIDHPPGCAIRSAPRPLRCSAAGGCARTRSRLVRTQAADCSARQGCATADVPPRCSMPIAAGQCAVLGYSSKLVLWVLKQGSTLGTQASLRRWAAVLGSTGEKMV